MKVDQTVFLCLVTSFGACLASVLVWSPDIRAETTVGILSIAPGWVMFCVYPHLYGTWAYSLRTIFAGVLATIVGILFSSIQMLSDAGRYVAVVLTFPFAFFLACCDETVPTPLKDIINPMAGLVALYIVLAFGPADLRESGRTGIEVTISFVMAGLGSTTSHLFWSLICRRGASLAGKDVERQLNGCLDSLVNALGDVTLQSQSLVGGYAHADEVQRKMKVLQSNMASLKAAAEVWQDEPWCEKPNPETLDALYAELNAATAHILALMTTMAEPYSANCSSALWQPTMSELTSMHLSTMAAYRLVAYEVAGKADQSAVDAAIAKAEEDAESYLASSRKAVVSMTTRDEAALRTGYDPAEATRTYCAQIALRQLPRRVAILRKSLCDANIPMFATRALPWREFICNSLNASTKLAKLLDPTKYFPPGASSTQDKQTLSERMRPHIGYPLRLAFANHSAALFLMWVRDQDIEGSKYVFWALLPFNFCFLPTLGAAVLKSSQRVAGTIVGACLAFLSLFANPGVGPAFFTELFVVSNIAMFQSSRGPLTDYAGLMIGMTWCIVVLGSWDIEDWESVREIAFWRVLMTISGVFYVVLYSAILFPRHATRSLEQQIGGILVNSTEWCIEVLQDTFLLAEKSTAAVIDNQAQAASIFTNIALMRSALADTTLLVPQAKAERCFVAARLDGIAELQHRAESFANAVVICNAACLDALETKCTVAVQYCLNADTPKGRDLKNSFEQAFAALRASTLGLSLFLLGTKESSHMHELAEAKKRLQTAFGVVREHAFVQGEMPNLQNHGVEQFWAVVYGLDNLMAECLGLEMLVSGVKVPPVILDKE